MSTPGGQMMFDQTLTSSMHYTEINNQHDTVNIKLENQEKNQFLFSLRSKHCLCCLKPSLPKSREQQDTQTKFFHIFNVENILVHNLLGAISFSTIFGEIYIYMFQSFGDRRRNLRLCLQLFLWKNKQKTLYFCIFKNLNNLLLSVCVIHMQKNPKIAGTVLGSQMNSELSSS